MIKNPINLDNHRSNKQQVSYTNVQIRAVKHGVRRPFDDNREGYQCRNGAEEADDAENSTPNGLDYGSFSVKHVVQ